MEFYQNKDIANDFSRTRYKVWAGVLNFLQSIPIDHLILDAGCGNGKNMLVTNHIFIGIDTSNELLEIVKEKSHDKNNIEIANASIISIPFKNKHFDDVISIAVIHHLITENDRLKAFEELIRVCKPNGKILITVWMVENNKFFKDSSPHSSNNINDRLVKWKLNDEIHYRFYHFYDYNEIITICEYLKNKYKIKYSINVETYNYYIIFDVT